MYSKWVLFVVCVAVMVGGRVVLRKRMVMIIVIFLSVLLCILIPPYNKLVCILMIHVIYKDVWSVSFFLIVFWFWETFKLNKMINIII